MLAACALLAAVATAAPPAPAPAGLSLSTYGNTVRAGAAAATKVIDGLSFAVPTTGGPLSLEVTGTMTAEPGKSYSFNCSFGAAQFAALHIDDHLVCQHGANSDSVLTPGQGSKAGEGSRQARADQDAASVGPHKFFKLGRSQPLRKFRIGMKNYQNFE